MADSKRYPAAPGLFTWPSDAPELIGSKCESCGSHFFPKQAEFHKPGCAGGPVQEVKLSRRGTLVSYTIQHFPPPPPFVRADPYVPMMVGTVAIPEGIQIPGQLLGFKPEELKSGVEVEVVVDTLYVDEEGNEALTWKFQPVRK